MITGWMTERQESPLIPNITLAFSEKGEVS
jgi:hypothetical protein